MCREESGGEDCEEAGEDDDGELLAVDGGAWARWGAEREGVGEDEGDGDE